ncbi:MAG TPA: PKD domain-containing protein, partial [Bacteroidia bacterium]|nr:PKD domain-containing protein [Bacteroidia bacterium]
FIQDGQLFIHTEIGDIAQARPVAYQEIDGKKVNVDCDFVLNNDVVGFNIKGNYNASLPLVIDPTLIFSTFSGSTADNWGMSATYDAVSNAYTSGICFGVGYPTTPGAFQITFQGGGTGGGNSYGGFDIVITKFNQGGTKQIFSTYLGGSDNEEPQSLIVDNQDNLLVLGRSYSKNFPTTPGVFSRLINGNGIDTVHADIIVSKFDSAGTLLASTYVGGSGDDGVNISAIETYLGSLKYNYADDGRGDIVVDNANNIYVASCTSSTDFPTTAGAFQRIAQGMQDGCAFKLNSNLSAMVWGTYLGGSSDDAAYNIALNSKGEVYIAGGTFSTNFPTTAGTLNPNYIGGIDGFVTHLSATGKMLQSSYLGTAGYDQAYFVQTDKYDNVYVYGQTSGSYPITAGTYSNANSGQFIHEMNSTLSKTIFSTEFGSGRGTPDIAPSAFLVDVCQNIYISGWGGVLYGYNVNTSSTIGLPVTSNAYRGTPNLCTYPINNGEDFYFMVLQKQAVSLWYATFWGPTTGGYPSGSLAHVDGGTSRFDKRGVIYQAMCGGCGGFSDIPTTPGVWSNTNNSSNCNNALVKFQMDLLETVASFIIDPLVSAGCAPFSVTFKNTTSYGQKYKWYFGNGDSSNAVSPNYIYTKPGTYRVMLTANDSLTCNTVDTTYAMVRVVPPLTLKAPSVSVCIGDSVALSAVAGSPSTF